MADIELVIKIPEKDYEMIKVFKESPACSITSRVYVAIANGIPLPKGHGRLIDADKLKHAFIKWSMAVQGSFTDSDIASIVYNSSTIIGADGGDAE